VEHLSLYYAPVKQPFLISGVIIYMPITLPVANQHRYQQLDSLRGLAALTVFIGHSIGTLINLKVLNQITPTPFSIFYNGYAGVMFFFVLSGFVLSLPFVNGDKPLSLTTFYTKRIFRIYPAFIVAIILSLVLKAFVYDKYVTAGPDLWVKQYWAWDWNNTSFKQILHTFLIIGPDFKTRLIDPPIWSLMVEVKMSVVLPFFILLVSRCNGMVNVILFFVLSALAYRYTGLQVSIFYLGVMLAKYKTYLLNIVNSWSVTVMLIVGVVSCLVYNAGLEFLNYHATSYYVVFSNYLPAIGSCFIILIVLANDKIGRVLTHRVFVFFGTISYSFYLLHFPMLIVTLSCMSNRFAYGLNVGVGLAFILSVSLAYVMVITIERPFQAMASRLVKRYKVLNTVNLKSLPWFKTV
jgi:peptidoglycan/LPS O-acetylase OafA/YrhL